MKDLGDVGDFERPGLSVEAFLKTAGVANA